MSKLLSPKVWYLVGLGAAALAVDGTRRMVQRRRRGAEVVVSGSAGPIPAPEATQPPAAQPAAEALRGADDLTEIKGIGPAYARRLVEAGYTTYADIANAGAEELRVASNAARPANPEEWIAAARARL